MGKSPQSWAWLCAFYLCSRLRGCTFPIRRPTPSVPRFGRKQMIFSDLFTSLTTRQPSVHFSTPPKFCFPLKIY